MPSPLTRAGATEMVPLVPRIHFTTGGPPVISVSDILKLLDKIPQWRALGELPGRMAELESRIAKLEAPATKPGRNSDPCPMCGEPLKMTGEKKDPTFGRFGVMNRSFTCTGCDYATERQWNPKDGYNMG